MAKNNKKEKVVNYGIGTIQLSGYETPEIVESPYRDWVNYGADNNYFDELIQRRMGSPTNSRCINGIINMIYGKGLEATDSDINIDGYAKMKVLIKNKDLKRVVNDYYGLGQAALMVYWNSDKTKILKTYHHPMETLRAEKAGKDGHINGWYYHPKWSELKTSDQPKRISSFGYGNKKERTEVFIFKPYKSGFYYYSPVDYQGCLQYCSLEEEVSNYHLSNINNGLAPSMMINFNNGIPDAPKQKELENKIEEKYSGSSNAGRFILSFNDSKETSSEVIPIHLPDAHAQYQFLSDEAREKIMLGHGIVSPILLGIKDNTGFGNNAEELRTASILMDNIVIRPFQDEIINGLNEILHQNGIVLDLYFTTLQPIEFTELDNISTKIKREEETGEKLSSVQDMIDLSDEEGDDLINQLEDLGETISDEWELIHSEEVNLSKNSFKISDLASKKYPEKDNWFKRNILRYFSDANPNEKSKEDEGIYKIRYAYSPVRNSDDSRDFCRRLEGFTKNNVVFRKEDINQMSFRGVNRKHGHKGSNYSLLKYKGGKYCKHFWELRVYKKKVDGKNIASEQEVINDGGTLPNNPEEMIVRPNDMPNGGAYPNNK